MRRFLLAAVMGESVLQSDAQSQRRTGLKIKPRRGGASRRNRTRDRGGSGAIRLAFMAISRSPAGKGSRLSDGNECLRGPVAQRRSDGHFHAALQKRDTKMSPLETGRRNPASVASFRRPRPALMCERAMSRAFRARSALVRVETDWLAGVVGLEPANPSANYLIGIARQLRLR